MVWNDNCHYSGSAKSNRRDFWSSVRKGRTKIRIEREWSTRQTELDMWSHLQPFCELC